MRTSRRGVAAAVLSLAIFPLISSAAALYSDDFNTNSSANYNTFITAGATGPSSDATYGYDYSALGVPVAPNTTDASTLGLRLRVDGLQNSVGTVVGAIELATKNLSLPSQYKMSVDVWANYIGGTTINDANGSNGSIGPTVGLGTAGTSLQYIAGNDGLLVETFNDNGGGANNQYRGYTNNTHPVPTAVNWFSAGTTATSASSTDPYYAYLGTHTAPTIQSSAATTQTGTTPPGIIGFAWHTETLTQDGTSVTWAIDGKTIETIPDSAFTAAGGQISIGSDDTNLSASTAANGPLYNFDIFDNLSVVAIPEPASLGLIGLAAFGLLSRRRKNA